LLLGAAGGLGWYLVDYCLELQAEKEADELLKAAEPHNHDAMRTAFRRVAELDGDRQRLAVLRRAFEPTYPGGPRPSYNSDELAVLLRAAVGIDPARREKAGKYLARLWNEKRSGNSHFKLAELIATLQPAEMRDSPEIVVELIATEFQPLEEWPRAAELYVARRDRAAAEALAMRTVELLFRGDLTPKKARGVRLMAPFLPETERAAVAERVVGWMETDLAQNAWPSAEAELLDAVLTPVPPAEPPAEVDRLRAAGLRLLLKELTRDPEWCHDPGQQAGKRMRELAGKEPSPGLRRELVAMAKSLAVVMEGVKGESYGPLANAFFTLTDGIDDPALPPLREAVAVGLLDRMRAAKRSDEALRLSIGLESYRGALPRPTTEIVNQYYQKVNRGEEHWWQSEVGQAAARLLEHDEEALRRRDQDRQQEREQKQKQTKELIAKLRALTPGANEKDLRYELRMIGPDLTADNIAFLHRRLIERGRDPAAGIGARAACFEELNRLQWDGRLTEAQSAEATRQFDELLSQAQDGELRFAEGQERAHRERLLLQLLTHYAPRLDDKQAAAAVAWALPAAVRAGEEPRTADYLLGLYRHLPADEQERVADQLTRRLRKYAALDGKAEVPFRQRTGSAQPAEGGGWDVGAAEALAFLVRLEELIDRVTPEQSVAVVRAAQAASWRRFGDVPFPPDGLRIEWGGIQPSLELEALEKYRMAEIVRIAARFAARVDPGPARELAAHFLEVPGGPGPNVPVFAALAGRLGEPELVDLLKQPGCVGAPEDAVLDELGRRHGREFRTVWEFADFARSNVPGIELRSPPRRPGPVAGP
jgi:hypothetical protein